MAKIPTLSSSPRARQSDPLNPTLSPREAGAPFRQNANLAEGISKGLMNIRNKQVAEANKVSYTKSNIALSQSFNEVEKQITEEYRANRPDHEGYADDAMERLNVSREAILGQAPESARGQIELAFTQKMANMKERFQSQESIGKSQYATAATKGMIDDAASLAYSNYSPLDMLEETTRLKGLVATSSKFDERGKAVLGNNINGVAKDMLNGVLDREDPAEMRRAIGDMESEDLAPVFGSMDPKDVTRTKAKLEKKLKYKQAESASLSNKNFRNFISASKAGLLNRGTPEDRKVSTNLKNELMASHGEKAAPMIDEIEAYEQVGEYHRDHAFDGTMDIEKAASEISEGSGDRLTSLGSKAKVMEILSSAERDRKKSMEKDFATYAAKNDSSIALNSKAMISSTGSPQDRGKFSQDYFNAIDARAEQSGIPLNKVKYLDSNLKQHYGQIKDLMEAGNHQAAAAMLEDFDSAMGGRAYRHMDELDMPKSLAIVSEIRDPKDRLNALKSVNDKELDGVYKNVAISRGIKDNKIREELMDNDLMRAMAIEDGGTSEGALHTNAMFESVHREYKRVVTSNPTISSEDAKQEAWNIFEKQYDTLENNGNLIPLPRNVNADNAQNYIDKYTGSADYVKDFNLRLTPKANGVSTTSEEMNDGLSSDSRWVYNRAQGGIVLMARQGDAKYRFVPDVDGKPVIRTFEQLDANNYKEDPKRKKAMEFINLMAKKGAQGI